MQIYIEPTVALEIDLIFYVRKHTHRRFHEEVHFTSIDPRSQRLRS